MPAGFILISKSPTEIHSSSSGSCNKSERLYFICQVGLLSLPSKGVSSENKHTPCTARVQINAFQVNGLQSG